MSSIKTNKGPGEQPEMGGLSLEDTGTARARVLSPDDLKRASALYDRNVKAAPEAIATTSELRALSMRIEASRNNAQSGKAEKSEEQAAIETQLKPRRPWITRR